MIKVNILAEPPFAYRDPIPDELKGLSNSTLQNLQTELNPVPQEFVGVEWWIENYENTPHDTETHKYGAEILTPDVATKTVNISYEIVALEPSVIATNLQNAKDIKIANISKQTRIDILAIASTEKQMLYMAKSIQYNRRNLPAEAQARDDLEAIFTQIETLVNDGNAREDLIALATTFDEVDNG